MPIISYPPSGAIFQRNSHQEEAKRISPGFKTNQDRIILSILIVSKSAIDRRNASLSEGVIHPASSRTNWERFLGGAYFSFSASIIKAVWVLPVFFAKDFNRALVSEGTLKLTCIFEYLLVSVLHIGENVFHPNVA
jgi:hypothetical protein